MIFGSQAAVSQFTLKLNVGKFSFLIMPKASPDELLQKLLEKFSESREFTISVVLHIIIIMVFGTTVLFQAVQEPPDFEGGEGGFVAGGDGGAPPPPQQQAMPQETTFNVTTAVTMPTETTLNAITTTAPTALNFTISPTIIPQMAAAPTAPTATQIAATTGAGMGTEGLTASQAAAIRAFTGGWGRGSGPGTGTRQREFEFTAYIGQYGGGNWNSTVRVVGGKIETGSLPNLLYLMSFWSKDRIKTNYKNVEAIKLDSDEIFRVKPPFIFMTGTRDFKLTDREVENLQKYIRMGGCIWGDASIPGKRSRFDIAFKREMKRVLPDVDKDWEPLPSNHPIFTQGYFPHVREVPPGINFYRDPIEVLRIYGEIAIIYTSNDYGDMFQIGLNQQGQIDTRRNARNQYVAINEQIYNNRHTYIRNITPESLKLCFEFGTNMVIHLLTRWEAKVRTAPSL